MTVEKKKEIVKKYCYGKKCDNCVLKDGKWEHITFSQGCLLINSANESELDKAIELICAPVEPAPTAQLEQIVEDADTVIKISSKRKLESVTIYFREEV